MRFFKINFARWQASSYLVADFTLATASPSSTAQRKLKQTQPLPRIPKREFYSYAYSEIQFVIVGQNPYNSIKIDEDQLSSLLSR